MKKIASAGNSDTACLQVVLEKGFKIESEVVGESGEEIVWFEAKKDDIILAANSGIELLGLVSLWEFAGKDWKDLLDKLPYNNISYKD